MTNKNRQRISRFQKRDKERHFKIGQNIKYTPVLLMDMTLQRTIGNQEIQRMFEMGDLMAKLSVSTPGDCYEQEADKTAKQVVGMQNITIQKKVKPTSVRNISSVRDHSVAQAFESKINSLKGNGQPLPRNIRDYFEPRFGVDFNHVRIHANPNANRLSRAIQAKAFTHGSNIVFAKGEYRPDSQTGKRLIAHELTHVLQQNKESSVQRKVEVNAGLTLDTMGYTTTKTGNIYTCPAVVKSSTWNEIFTALFHSPRIFKLFGTNNSEINKSLLEHITARFNIVNFASKKKYTFGAGLSMTMNSKYWVKIGNSWNFKPAPTGIDPADWKQEAINDLNVNPTDYSIACQAATMLTMWGGSGTLSLTYGSSSDTSDWIPGDWGYVENTNFSGSPIGTEGENIIYTGKDLFWGHLSSANTYHTLMEWFNKVKAWDNGASILDQRTYPSNGLE